MYSKVYSSPALSTDGNVVYVGSDDHNLYAVNASTGSQIWSLATGSEVDSSRSSPALSSDSKVVYVGSGSDGQNLPLAVSWTPGSTGSSFAL